MEFFASIIKGAQDVANMQKLGQTPNPMVEVLTREKQEELWGAEAKGRGFMKTEAETGVMLPQN